MQIKQEVTSPYEASEWLSALYQFFRANAGLYFFIFVFSIQLTVNK